MQNFTSQSIYEIPLPGLTGSGLPPELQFNDSATQLLVTYPTQIYPSQSWWNIHKVDVAASAAILSFVLLVWLLVRHLRRPQQPGRYYCQSCNYDLPPLELIETFSLDSPKLCPECGTGLTTRPPKAGRHLIQRVIIPIYILAFICYLSVSTWSRCVEKKLISNDAWPVAALGHLSWWPVARKPPPSTRAFAFETYSIADFKQLARAVIDTPLWATAPSADFRFLARTRFPTPESKHYRAVLLELATGKERVIDFGTPGSAKLHGFTADKKEVIYSHTSSPNPDQSCTIQLFCVSLDTLKLREVGHLTGLSSQLSDTNMRILPTFTAAVGGTPEQWAVLITYGAESGKLTHGKTSESNAPSTFQLDLGKRTTVGAELEFNGPDSLRFDTTNEISLSTQSMRGISTPVPDTIHTEGTKLVVTRGSGTVHTIASNPAVQISILRPATPSVPASQQTITVSHDARLACFPDLSIPPAPAPVTWKAILISLPENFKK